MIIINQKIYSSRILESLYFVFIFIRSNPRNPLHTQTLKVYRYELLKNGINKRLNEELKKKLLNIGVPKDSSIVRALEKWSFPLKKYSMKRVERSIPIFIDIFTELIKNLELEEYEKASVLASAVHNLPGFVSKEYGSKPKSALDSMNRG